MNGFKVNMGIKTIDKPYKWAGLLEIQRFDRLEIKAVFDVLVQCPTSDVQRGSV